MHKFTSLVEASLLNGVNSLKKQQLNLNKCLPSGFIGKLFVTKFSPQQIVIAACSAAWANKARYYIPVIQKNLMVSSVKIAVMPAAFLQKAPLSDDRTNPAPKKLSTVAQQCLQNCAHSVSDPELKKALIQFLENVARQ